MRDFFKNIKTREVLSFSMFVVIEWTKAWM